MKYLLLFSFLLFELLSYGQIDTLLRPYKVPIPDYERPDYNDNSITYLVAFDFKIDILPFNFNEFRSQLGDDNIGLMNKANSVLDTELGLFYKDLYGGISVGIGGTNKELDSLNLDFNNHLYGINIGYKIINTKRIIIVPKLGLKLQHFRLINSTH